MPRLSVLMPVFNAENYLAEAIDSVLNNSFTDLEILILNDGSSDRSLDIANRAQASEDGRVIVRDQENQGTARARASLLTWGAGRSEFVAWADADDIQLKNRFRRQIDHLTENTACIGVGGWALGFGSKRGIKRRPCSAAAVRVTSLLGAPVVFPTFTHRVTGQMLENCDFAPSLGSSEDYAFVNSILAMGEVENQARITTRYRYHSNQESQAHYDRQIDAHATIMRRRIKAVCGWVPEGMQLQSLINPSLNQSDPEELVNVHNQLWLHFSDRHPEDIDYLSGLITYRFLRYNWRRPVQTYSVLRGAPWFSFASLRRLFP